MPFNSAFLQSDLLQLFREPPGTRIECAQAWSDAMRRFFATVAPASATVPAAALALTSALDAAFATSAAAVPMETAFLTFATTVGGGMAGFVGTPPPGTVGFVTLLGSNQPTHESAAQLWATQIEVWARTGTAVSAAGGATVPWA